MAHTQEQVRNDILEILPSGVKLTIEVVFPGEYRIGFEYQERKYTPGAGNYYEFDVALRECLKEFYYTFPEEAGFPQCPNCNGVGQVCFPATPIPDTCRVCGGVGDVSYKKYLAYIKQEQRKSGVKK